MSLSGCSFLEAGLSAKVFGVVQGVFFRSGTVAEARRLGLKGWVANAEDGTVELEAEGGREALDELLAWLHCGPPSARVERVEFEWKAKSGRYPDFRAVNGPGRRTSPP